MIYLDNNATTPLDPRVFDAMKPFFLEHFGNPSSRQHSVGSYAATAVSKARQQVAALLHADPREIVFTSGATESCNLALKGAIESPAYKHRKKRIVTVSTEHRAVLDSCDHLGQNGVEIVILGVDSNGLVDLAALRDAVAEDTLLVSVMHGNNETGVLQPIREIGEICREHGALFHTDATQTFGKKPLDLSELAIDLLSLSAHKCYGPKGCGALYVRRRRPRVRCEPLVHGGGHELGRRSGTLNVPGIVGLGAAAAICSEEHETEQLKLGSLRGRLERGLTQALEGVTIACEKAPRLANTTNLSFAETTADAIMERAPDVAVSNAAACTTEKIQPSYVLNALGLSGAAARGSLRFSLGRFSTEAEVDDAISALRTAVEAARAESRLGRDRHEEGTCAL